MSKILTIVGTRPEIIRLSVIMKKLDNSCTNIIVNTGQNYDSNLNDIFWQQLNLRKPNYNINSKSETSANQISKMFIGIEEIIKKEKPSAALILGDTYSGLCSIICERYNVPVYHMEAGNRCWDNAVPEEKNRKIIDAVSSYNLPYTSYSYNNLKKLGHEDNKLFISGNPIFEVIKYYEKNVDDSKNQMNEKRYGLATFHRAECVDDQKNLLNIINGLIMTSEELDMKIFCSIHPRTKQKLKTLNIETPENIIFSDPIGFFEFIKLEKQASLILTDSGTVSEESCIFNVPCVTMREVTERQELVSCGSTMLSGLIDKNIVLKAKEMINKKNWQIPEEYLWCDVSEKVINKILG